MSTKVILFLIGCIWGSLNSFSQYKSVLNYDNLGRLEGVNDSNHLQVFKYSLNDNRVSYVIRKDNLNVDLLWNSYAITVSSFAGKTVLSINASLYNASQLPSNRSQLNFILSSASLINSGAKNLDSLRLNSLSPQSSFTLNNKEIVLPANTLPGNYYLLLYADANNEISESDEANNIAAIPFTITNCSPITLSPMVVNPGCGLSTGSITIQASGGQAPFQYSINGGATFSPNPGFNNLGPGRYTCIVKDSKGCTGTQVVDLVPVSSASPTASFDFSIGKSGVVFGNTSSNSTTYKWAFGDGNTSISHSPVHRYSSPGIYTVCLTAFNACGSAQVCKAVVMVNQDSAKDENLFARYYSVPGELVRFHYVIPTPDNSGYYFTGAGRKDTIVSGSATVRDMGLYGKIDQQGRVVWVRRIRPGAGLFASTFNLYLTGQNTLMIHGYTFQNAQNSIGYGLMEVNTSDGQIIRQKSFPGISDFVKVAGGYIGHGTNSGVNGKYNMVKVNNALDVEWEKQFELKVYDCPPGLCTNILSRNIASSEDGGVLLFGRAANQSFANPVGYVIKITGQGTLEWSTIIRPADGTLFEPNFAIIDNNGFVVLTSGNKVVKLRNNNGLLNSMAQHASIGNILYQLPNGNYMFSSNGLFTETTSSLGFVGSKRVHFSGLDRPLYGNHNQFAEYNMGIGGITVNRPGNTAALSSNVLANYRTDFLKGTRCDQITDTVFQLEPLTGTSTFFPTTIQPFTSGSFISGQTSHVYTIQSTELCSLTGVVTMAASDECTVSALFNSNQEGYCIGQTANFNSQATNGALVKWRVNNNNLGTAATQNFTFTTPGYYVVQHIAQIGDCIDTVSIAFLVNSDINITASSKGANCTASNGEIKLFSTGGTLPYTFSFKDSIDNLSNVFTGLKAGDYEFTVTDLGGCSKQVNFPVSSLPSSLQVRVDSIRVSCATDASGVLTATAFNGAVPYTYIWNNQDSIRTIDKLIPNTYSLFIKDANGCTINQNIILGPAPRDGIRRSIASGNWTSPSIWEAGILPGDCDSVVIQTGNLIQLNSNATIRALYIAANGQLIINRADTLQIGLENKSNAVSDGSLQISNGMLLVNGRLKLASGSFQMTAGRIKINGNSGDVSNSVPNGTHLFEVSPAMVTFSLTGGMIQFVNPPIGPNSQAISCLNNFGDNSTLILGDGISILSSNNPNGFGGNLLPSHIGKLIIDTKTTNGNRHFINLNPISAKSPVQVISGELIQKARFEVRQ